MTPTHMVLKALRKASYSLVHCTPCINMQSNPILRTIVGRWLDTPSAAFVALSLSSFLGFISVKFTSEQRCRGSNVDTSLIVRIRY